MRVTPTVGLWPWVGCSQKEADGPIEVGAPWCVFEEMCFTETPALSLRDSVKPRATGTSRPGTRSWLPGRGQTLKTISER